MIKIKLFKPFFVFLLLTGTLLAKEAPREFAFSSFLSDLESSSPIAFPLTPKELIKPVTIDTNCDFDFPSIFQYLWI